MNRKEETNGGKDEGIVLMTNIKTQCESGVRKWYFSNIWQRENTFQPLVYMFNPVLIHQHYAQSLNDWFSDLFFKTHCVHFRSNF